MRTTQLTGLRKCAAGQPQPDYTRMMQGLPQRDYGAALANNLSDDAREQILITRDKNQDIQAFAKRAKSAFYCSGNNTKHPLKTFDAWQAFATSCPVSARYWKDRIKQITSKQEWDILKNIPDDRISEISREFTARLLIDRRTWLLGIDTNAGSKTMWIGLQRTYDFAMAWKIFRSDAKNDAEDV
jgi:hypothetical protein